MAGICNAGGNHSQCIEIFTSLRPASKLNICAFFQGNFAEREKWPAPEYICLSANIKIQEILFVFIYQEKLILTFTLN